MHQSRRAQAYDVPLPIDQFETQIEAEVKDIASKSTSDWADRKAEQMVEFSYSPIAVSEYDMTGECDDTMTGECDGATIQLFRKS